MRESGQLPLYQRNGLMESQLRENPDVSPWNLGPFHLGWLLVAWPLSGIEEEVLETVPQPGEFLGP